MQDYEESGISYMDRKTPFFALIFAMLMQGAAGIWIVADIKKDVEILKSQSIVQRDRDARQDMASSDSVIQLRTQLEKMDMKLDRLVERGQR